MTARVELVPLKEVQPLTGYIRGGVTVLGAKKDYPVLADETIELWDVVSISGRRAWNPDSDCSRRLSADHQCDRRRDRTREDGLARRQLFYGCPRNSAIIGTSVLPSHPGA